MAKPKNAAKELFTDDLARLQGAKNLADVYASLEARSKKISVNSGDFVDTLQDAFEEAENIAESQKDLFSTTVNLKSLQKKANAEENKEQKRIYQKLVLQGRAQVNLRKSADLALKKYKKKEAVVKKVTDMIPGVGGMLGNIIDGVGDAYKDGLGKGLDKGGAQLMGIGKGFKVVGGLMVAAIFKSFYSNMTELGVGLKDTFTRPEFFLFGSEMRALSQEFGNINEGSMKLGLSMKMTSIFSGVTAENQAKILGAMAATSDASIEVLQSQMKAYKQAGVPFKAIMDDVAGNTELFAKFGKDGGANIFEAAKRAKELGVNLSDVSSITESLLNFEESIEAQMNAQVLLGRNISLDRARQLAFTGDQAGMMDEIVKQVGGEAEFNNLNVIQRKALADSVGLSVERMSALVRAEEQNAAAADKTRSKYIAMGAILGALIGLVVGGLTLGTALPAALGAMGVGALAGGAIGTGIGTMFPMADGGIVTGPTNAMVGEAGPEMVTPLPTEGVKMDTKPLENKFDQLIAMNKRLVDEIGNLQVGA